MSKQRDNLVRSDCPLPQGASVVAYCRDSGNDDQDRSVGQQREAIVEYCRTHGLMLEQVYFDLAHTGSNAEARDGLNTMLHDLRARFKPVRDRFKREKAAAEKPFGLIFWKSNRLGRDSVETTHIKADVRMRGLTLISLVTSGETGNPLIDGVLEAFQQYQDQQAVDEISDNTRRGLAQLVRMRDTDPMFRSHNPRWPTMDGRYLAIKPGVVPVGFRAERIVIGANRRGETREVQRIVPDPDVMPRVILAWSMRLRGATINEIHNATRLHNRPTGYGWMFANRIYTGVLEYGGQTIENFVEPIITVADFETEQARRVERGTAWKNALGSKHHPRSVSSRHILSGLVKCGANEGEENEHPMHAETAAATAKRKSWDYYTCTRRRNTKGQACSLPYASARGLEALVLDHLINEVLTVEALRPLAKSIAIADVKSAEESRTKMAVVSRRLGDIDRAIERLLDNIETSGGNESLNTRLRKRESERLVAAQEVGVLRENIARAETVKLPTDAQLEDWILSMRAALQSNDVTLVRDALSMLVQKVVVTGKQTAVIHCMPLLSDDVSRVQPMTPTGASINTRYALISKPLKWWRQPPHRIWTDAEIERRREAKAMRSEGYTYAKIARQCEVSIETARMWVNQDLPSKSA